LTSKPDIAGADDVVRWFGEWPSFHDAEVLSVHLEHDA
jgi:Immunity protein 50